MIDDRYTTGVYYDEMTDECYTFRRHEESEEVRLYDPRTSEFIEALDYEEFRDIQDGLHPVPEKAVKNPVAYFTEYIGEKLSNDFDPGFTYADRATEIVEESREDT